MVRLAGADPVFVETKEENGWKLTAEEFENAMTPRTKMIIINSPNNPTGAVYTRHELEAIAAVAAEEEILILADEIYEKLVYEGAEHVSIASLGPEYYDLTITVNGFSKAYAMTGWRLGYLGAPEPIARAIDSIQSHVTSNPCSFAQKGALAALKGDQQTISDMREEFDLRRQYMADRLSKISNLSIVRSGWRVLRARQYRSAGPYLTNFADRLLSKAMSLSFPELLSAMIARFGSVMRPASISSIEAWTDLRISAGPFNSGLELHITANIKAGETSLRRPARGA